MDGHAEPKQQTRQTAAKRVEAAIVAATALILAADYVGWQELPFFALWGVGWTILYWVLLPEAQP